MKYVLPLSKVDRDDVALVGGKAANLGEMTRLNLPVPPGFVAAASAYQKFLADSNLTERISSLLEKARGDNPESLEEASQLIKRVVKSAPVPAEVETEVATALKTIFPRQGKLFAVRSSSVGEDLVTATAAGQQSTYLNVASKDILSRVKDVWASLFNARAIYYRRVKGQPLTKALVAVVVQEMVDSEASGVAFSLDPLSGDKSKITVEAIYGLGELIAQGEVNPDHYELDKKTLELTYQEIGLQEKQLLRVGHENRLAPVSKIFGAQPKIDLAVVKEIGRLARSLEEHYLRPQNIEWAYQDHTLYLVQTRPAAVPPKLVKPAREIALPLVVSGAPASPGLASGKVVLVKSPRDLERVGRGAVLVTKVSSPDLIQVMKKAAAIVTDSGGRSAHAAILGRELGIPVVVGTGQATMLMKPGRFYTVNGTTGRIHLGALTKGVSFLPYVATVTPLKLNKLITATKIMLDLSDPSLAREAASLPSDGLGFARLEESIKKIGIHPGHALKEKIGPAYVARLTESIFTLAKSFAERPVIIQTSNFLSSESTSLKGGGQFGEVEVNPILGLRGAKRHTQNPEEFILELEAIKRARNVHGLKNIHLALPWVGTPEEFVEIKKLVTAAGLNRGPSFKLYLTAALPANILELESLAELGLDGIIVDYQNLAKLTLGSENIPTETSESVFQLLEKAGRTGRKLGLDVGIVGGDFTNDDLIEKLVGWGYSYISVLPDQLEKVRKEVSVFESKLTKNKS